MRRADKRSISVEEAVGAMVNMDYIPEKLTLLEMLAAFQEEAEVEYENAPSYKLTGEEIKVLETRMQACRARYTLAEHLIESLQYEVNHCEESSIVLADESFSKQRLTVQSVSDWAADRYGIGVPWNDFSTAKKTQKKFNWEDVRIIIWEDGTIKYSIKGGKYRKSHFRDIGLMAISSTKTEPNKLGFKLQILAMDNNAFIGPSQGKDRTEISRIRGALKKLTGLETDPFKKRNKFDGWVPRFIIGYDPDNGAIFTRNDGVHRNFDDTSYYKKTEEDENDHDDDQNDHYQ